MTQCSGFIVHWLYSQTEWLATPSGCGLGIERLQGVGGLHREGGVASVGLCIHCNDSLLVKD